jgi:hypothetical protein
MMLAASTDWFQRFASEFLAWAHSSIFSEIWFQNAILVFSAWIAIRTLSSSSRHERRRATVDIVRDQQKDDVLIKARATIRSVQDASGKIDFNPILAQKDSAELRAIYDVLNSYEFMASGLRTGAFDEETYKRMYYNTVVSHWSLFHEFIEKYREKFKKENPGVAGLAAGTLYQDFQTLATNWLQYPLKRIRTSWNPFKKKPVAPISRPPALPKSPVQTHAPVPPQQTVSPPPLTPPAKGTSV